jgi:hypothetical protein
MNRAVAQRQSMPSTCRRPSWTLRISSACAASATTSPKASYARTVATPTASAKVVCVVEEPHNIVGIETTR